MRKCKHGAYKTPLYQTWADMKSRCNNPKSTNYKKYGAKGITICPEWCDFITFQQWALTNGYQNNLTIDRIDGTKNYTPENCQWLTLSDNSRKTSRSIYYTIDGITKTRLEWEQFLKIGDRTFRNIQKRRSITELEYLSYKYYNKGKRFKGGGSE